MAGTNQILKAGQTLFVEGDPSDGMYLVRSGELVVYLAKGGTEIKLATIQPGAMIGEMAFFDQKPRSASVKAVADAEVTKISNDDFGKLMKQIPKWFVSLMASLSTRLRETNDRVQGLEAKVKRADNVILATARVLRFVDLLWHKDGTKQGKEWFLDHKAASDEVSVIFGMDKDRVTLLFQVLAEAKVFSIKQDSYKNKVLALGQRGTLGRLAGFMEAFATQFPEEKSAPTAIVQLIETVQMLAQESAYETLSLPFDDVVLEGARHSFDTSSWKNALRFVAVAADCMTLVKVSGGKAGIKIVKKELPRTAECFRVLHALSALNL